MVSLNGVSAIASKIPHHLVYRLTVPITLALSSLSPPALAMAFSPEPRLETLVQSSSRFIEFPIAQANSPTATLLEQGIQSLEQGQLDAAQTALNKALAQAREQADTQDIAQALSHLGVIYALQADYGAAISAYQEALSLVDDTPGLNRQLWNRLGLTYFWQTEYDRAIQAYETALTFAETEGDPEKIAVTLGFMANVYAEIGAHAEAIDHYQRSLNLTQAPTTQISGFSALGHLYLADGQLTEAVKHYEAALALMQQGGDPTQVYPLLNTLASAQLGLQQFIAARDNARQAIDLAAADQAPEFEMDARSILGQAYAGLNQVEAAIAAHGRALALAQTLAAPQQEVLALMSLGSLYQGIGNAVEAIDAFEQVLILTAETEAQTQTSYGALAEDALKFLGQIHIGLGDYGRAIAYFQQMLQVAQADADPANEIIAYQKIGDAYYASGRYDQALEHYQQALTQAEATTNPTQQASALTNLVSGYRALNQFEDAQQFAEQAVKIAQSLDDPWAQGMALWELGNVQLLVQNDQVIDTLQTLLSLRESDANGFPESLALRSLGSAHLAFGNPSTAIELLQQALVLDQQQQEIEAQGHTLSELGSAYQQMGDLESAEAALRQAVAIWDTLRANLGDRDDIKVSLLTRQRVAYQQLQTVLVAQGKPLEALEVAERSRARALADLLSQQLSPRPDQLPTTQSPTLAEIVNIAKTQNATLVEYAETLEALYIWVIKPSGEIIFEQVEVFNPGAQLPAAARPLIDQPTLLSSAIADTRSAFGVPDWNRPRPSAQVARANERLETLYSLLIEPIADHLPTQPEDRVIFIPQGELFQVAFPALRNRQGQYLIENHTVLTAPSIKMLSLTQQLSQTQRSAPSSVQDRLVVGNPVMPALPRNPDVTLDSLPGAEEEALTIANLLQTSALIGSAATEPVITQKMQTASMIHLATHGLLDYGAPEVSLVRDVPGAIALTPDPSLNGPAGDGLLTAREIMTLSLKAELVVLSACNTGRGEITADGVIGLSRALITAGVPSVVVSLWAVPDAPTALLMTEFYRQLQNTPDKAQALRQAMLTTLETHPNPADWAAFTLIGEAQ